jgi:hypothetical protein
MKNHFIFITIMIFLSLQLTGQTKIEGNVFDASLCKPVEYATVYINGTTHGTRTDSKGFYKLENIEFPCLLIVSHVSYQTQTFQLKKGGEIKDSIKLLPKEIVVEEVDILENNKREKNLTLFKNLFLGSDVWGKYAAIENEDALSFILDYKNKQKTIKKKKHIELPSYTITTEEINDSIRITYKQQISFTATSNESLLINLPLLGYKITFNLINFINGDDPEINYQHCSILGYYYFQQIPYASKRDSVRIARNRQKAFCNSQMHFCRSLYQKELHKNGYYLFDISKDSLTGFIKYHEVDINNLLSFKDNVAEIIGLKDKEFIIAYYQLSDGVPLNLTAMNGFKPYKTKIKLLSDTCIIRKDGTVPDNSIAFSSIIGNKRIGAQLPGDYKPAK